MKDSRVILLFCFIFGGTVQSQTIQEADTSLRDLILTLDTMFNDHQSDRLRADEIDLKYGMRSEQKRQLWKTIRYKDSVNILRLKRVLDSYGWLGPDKIGDQGSTTLYLVLGNSDLKTQEKYLPLMIEAVNQNKAPKSQLAHIEDKVDLKQGQRQKYGTQIGTNQKTGASFVFPLTDPDKVDELRKEAGLESMADYVKNFGMTWDLEQYKKDLPELERQVLAKWTE